jgi:hypothetical protein
VEFGNVETEEDFEEEFIGKEADGRCILWKHLCGHNGLIDLIVMSITNNELKLVTSSCLGNESGNDYVRDSASASPDALSANRG